VDDRSLVRALEDCSLPLGELTHAAHVQVAWYYLRAAPFGQAGDRFCSALRRFAEASGKAGLFHETITWAYVALINERRATADGHGDFGAFADANPDLFDHKNGALSRIYAPETLASDLARRVFVLPRPAVPSGGPRDASSPLPRA